MENEKVVKFFIGTLLNETVETVEVKPQEFTYTDELAGIAVFRVDFIATFKNSEGEYKKVLIEIQKANKQNDILRFRNYLAEQYKKEDIVNGESVILPITTIYILGFKLPEINTPCLKVERNYKDLTFNEPQNTKSEFIEKLTHDSYIVQVERITDKYQTKLDKLLSVFEQKNFVDDTKITKEYKHIADIEEVKIITEILHHSGTNPDEKKKIEIEKEAWRTINSYMEDEFKRLTKTINEKDVALNEKDVALNEKDVALNEKDIALNEKDVALNEKDQIIADLLRKLNNK